MRIAISILIFASADFALAGDNLRIATFNINWGNVNLPDIKRVIDAANADVVCVQESTAASERFLSREFRATYPHIKFKGYKGRFAAERFGFISRLPLNNIRYKPPGKGLFGTYFAQFKHNDREVRIANVHLTPFTVRRGAGFRGAMNALSAVEVKHKDEIRAIESEIDVSKPTLVCGDFNSLSTFVAPKRLAELGLSDSFSAVTKNADANPTWRWPVGKMHIQFRIDYIFHSTHFKTADSKIIPTIGSDHFLVVSEFKHNR